MPQSRTKMLSWAQTEKRASIRRSYAAITRVVVREEKTASAAAFPLVFYLEVHFVDYHFDYPVACRGAVRRDVIINLFPTGKIILFLSRIDAGTFLQLG